MIRQLHQRGAHLVDIAHQIGCCERTVRRHLAREEAPTGRPARPRASKLEPYKLIIDQLVGYPRFKSKRGKPSSYHCVGVKAGDDRIKVPKLGPIRARMHRKVEGRLKSITLTRTVTGKHYASLLFDTEQAAPAPLKTVDAAKVVGLDMGLSHLAIDSTGRKIANPRFLKQAQHNLKRKQQALSRCQKGS